MKDPIKLYKICVNLDPPGGKNSLFFLRVKSFKCIRVIGKVSTPIDHSKSCRNLVASDNNTLKSHLQIIQMLRWFVGNVSSRPKKTRKFYVKN